jgi:hypothetical protein
MKETICDFIKCDYHANEACTANHVSESYMYSELVNNFPLLLDSIMHFLYSRDMASKNVHNRKCGLQFLADITSLIINKLNIKIQWNMNCQFVSTHSKAGLRIKKKLDEINLSPLNNTIFHMVLELFWL